MRLLIVDGHGYAYRTFYAIRGMHGPDGRGTGGIFGFVKTMARLAAGQWGEGKWTPSHGVVVWDGGLSRERLAALPAYKAERPEMPADLAVQIEGMMGWCGAAGWASVQREGVEADDWIGCLARKAELAGWEVVIASADKDFMQLVTLGTGASVLGSGEQSREAKPETRGWVGLLNPNDKVARIWGAADVRSKTGVEPSQVVDWLSLLGDAVDGIPGVPGVGAKTAAGLLGQFGTVEGIYGRLDEVKSVRVREALKLAQGEVRRNQDLVRLPEVAGCEFVPGELELGREDAERLAGLYRGWGFRGLLAEVEGGRRSEVGKQTSDLGSRASTVGQGELL